MSRPDYEADDLADLAYLDQLAADLDADRLDAADYVMRSRLLSDEEEAELEHLEFLERTAGLDASDVYPRTDETAERARQGDE